MPTDEDLQILRERTIARLLVHAPADGLHATALPWLRLIRASAPAQPVPAVYEPGLVLVLQGRKQAQLGDAVVRYDAMQCLVVPMTMLPRGRVVEASPDKPYLCMRLSCETQALAELLLDGDAPRPMPMPACTSPPSPRRCWMRRCACCNCWTSRGT